MSWLQFRLDTSATLAPLCEDSLLGLGAAAVTLQDNADEPLFDKGLEAAPLWRETCVTGLFSAATNIDQLWQALPADIRQHCRYRAEILEDKDWEREWMQHYSPIQCGDGLWICPSWMEPTDPAAVNVLLDPGLAFGTGTHPTTAMCLRELQRLQPAGKTVLDYGCGSGILAIATLLLGAGSAIAIDNDPQALVATRNNAQLNNIDPQRIQVSLPGAQHPAAQLVVANILAGPLCQLAATLYGSLLPGGELLLSGILAEQVEEVRSAYREFVQLQVSAEHDDWVVLQGTRS